MDPITDKGETPQAPGATPPATIPQADEQDQGVTPEPKTYSPEYVQRINRENAARRRENDDLAAKLKTLEDEKLSASQKLERDLAELRDKHQKSETERNELRLAAAIKDAASAAGMTKLAAAWALADKELVERDPVTGEPTANSIAAIVSGLKSGYPEFFGVPPMPASGGPANPARKTALSVEAIQAMTPEQYEAHRDEIMTFLSGNGKL